MVLVVWQLATGQQQFLPRLGESITSVSTEASGLLYGCVCSDNAIRIVDSASMDIVQYIQGVYRASKTVSTGLILEPRRGAAVFSGRSGMLQFFDYNQDKAVAELEVSPQNVISRTNEQPISYYHVEHAAFSPSGAHLITVECREEVSKVMLGDAGSSVLKFWCYDEREGSYVLNTRADTAHKGKITALAYHPKGNMAVTAGEDHSFKLWRLENREEAHKMAASNGNNEQLTLMWVCARVGNWREQAPQSVSFSPDGTLLAVSYGSVVTLWKPDSLSLVSTLPQKGTVKEMKFVAGSALLAVSTDEGVTLWNLLTCSVWWSYGGSIVRMVVHPHRPALALLAEFVGTSSEDGGEEKEEGEGEGGEAKATSEWGVILFGDAKSPIPTAAWPLEHGADSIAFAPAGGGKWAAVDMAASSPLQLLLIGAHLELSLLCDTEMAAQGEGSPSGDKIEFDASPFEATFGISTKALNGAPTTEKIGVGAKVTVGKGAEAVFGGTPSHAMPPLAKMFGQFIARMLPPKSKWDDAIEEVTERVGRYGTEMECGDESLAPGKPVVSRAQKRMLKQVEPAEAVYEAFEGYFGASSPTKSPKSSAKRKKSA